MSGSPGQPEASTFLWNPGSLDHAAEVLLALPEIHDYGPVLTQGEDVQGPAGLIHGDARRILQLAVIGGYQRDRGPLAIETAPVSASPSSYRVDISGVLVQAL